MFDVIQGERNFLSSCAWQTFDLAPENIIFHSERIWLVEKWNWDYAKALSFQQFCVEQLRQHKYISIFIFCCHPHCFTLGKGLQKLKAKETSAPLIDFDPALRERLPYPLHNISRGGGITFHYPGQWVCYPIINLARPGFTVFGLIEALLKAASSAIHEMDSQLNLNYDHELLGLWHNNKKLASVGLAISRLITYHGMALNIYEDESMTRALQMINPCGLPGATFTQLEKLVPGHSNLFARFHHTFKAKLLLQCDERS
ncbi:MAG: lipoyl(octanoyl) transferase LipB [Bdellovibrio sp.]|nr:lipoyl(octanoyl) transferase LipB [Bdellovibrio sp.]